MFFAPRLIFRLESNQKLVAGSDSVTNEIVVPETVFLDTIPDNRIHKIESQEDGVALPAEDVYKNVLRFLLAAKQYPETTYVCTEINAQDEELQRLLLRAYARRPKNVVVPIRFGTNDIL